MLLKLLFLLTRKMNICDRHYFVGLALKRCSREINDIVQSRVSKTFLKSETICHWNRWELSMRLNLPACFPSFMEVIPYLHVLLYQCVRDLLLNGKPVHGRIAVAIRASLYGQYDQLKDTTL